ncbi:hypothetical protein [Oecophyllibacter saccharovorans]|uniref:Uncharacterized protein n=1 Tax=Oecophyllibacter saccharovorans TaxID=2558360 RepID=A0A506ULB1_9PROT|nr:hypothetical protein [Oecophyllibacter saccharovorans]QDH15312.1 hypothetical protein E3E11_05000 [Oecophyllibacter saccharovorans]TPW34144.1 hypothetical protein E3202_06355 [Oecophyllibacter saccharovorans]TPW36329.1 hypothetical protein E3203_00585 [Oecophyllibacter saccharovorans]
MRSALLGTLLGALFALPFVWRGVCVLPPPPPKPPAPPPPRPAPLPPPPKPLPAVPPKPPVPPAPPKPVVKPKPVVVPKPPAPKPPPPKPLPPKPVSKPEPLPLDKWRQHDTSFLDGCWNRRTHMVTHDVDTGEASAVGSWRLCFNTRGQTGTETLIWKNGGICQGPLKTHFEGNILVIDAGFCPAKVGDRNFLPAQFRCTRLDAQHASCPSVNKEDGSPIHFPGGHDPVEGLFERISGPHLKGR